METDVARNITKHFRVGTARTPEKTSPVFAPVPVKGVDQHATAVDACEACGTDLFDLRTLAAALLHRAAPNALAV